VTGLLLRVPAEDHRALCTHDLTGLHPWGGTRAMVGTNPLAPGDAPTKCNVFIAMDPRAPGHDRVREPGARACATRAANLADAVPVSQVTWTSAQQIAADVPERH
jgi:LDH2 family malate/lactate/ureidoglycolate dehydrogenase